MFGLGIAELAVILIILGILGAVFILVLIILKSASNKAVKNIKREDSMFCRKCGTQNPDAVMKCSKCGNDLQAARAASGELQPNVSNYLVQAILVAIFCCWPFALPAFYFAGKTNGSLSSGDYKGAEESSKKAKMWCWVSFGVAISLWLLYILLVVIVGIGAGFGRFE